MALTDLANLDLLDAVLAHHFTEAMREKMLNTYMEAYTQVTGEALNKEFKPEDNQAMDKLLADPSLTPQKLDQFYIDRIPHFQAKMILLSLEFKKRFLLDVYRNKVEEYKSLSDKQGLAAWEQIYRDAQADNWNEVARLLKVVDSIGRSTSISSPAPAALATT